MTLTVRATNLGAAASASEVIFAALREAIVDGALADGQTLRQEEIAALFNVSRIPVREALARLEQHGLVTTQRYKGAVVAALSPDEIRELFEFRALLESEVIGHAVARVRPESLDEAARHCTTFSASDDPAVWAQANRLFHYALYRDCGRPYHLQVVSNALDKIGRYLRAQLTLTDGIERARREHAAILQAALDRDAEQAARLTRAHILGASRSLTAFLEGGRARPAG